jgi:signal transduction histidine kinase
MAFKTLPLILLITVVALLCLCSGCRVSDDPLSRAQQGVVDLSALDLQHAEPIRLDGDWEFYWKQLLTPADFKAGQPTQATGYLALPTAWNDTLSNGKKRESAGYATFRLRILPGQARQELTLQLGELYSAYRLWVNGSLRVENGVIGKNSSEEIPAQAIRQTRLQLDGQPLELLLQVSNYHHRSGGVVAPIRLGATEKLESAQLKQWALALLCIGSLLVMGFYHIGLYGIRKKDRAPLYFGIYSLLWAGSSLTSNATDWAVNLLVDHYSPWFINRFDLICFVLSLPVGYSFFRTLYPAEFSRRLQQITLFVALVATVLGLTLPTMAFTTIVPAFYLFATAMILYCLVMLFRAMRTGREAAVLILAGFLVMGATGINDMLYDLQLIQSVYLIHIGMFIFIFFQAIALSIRFSRSFSAVEQLSDELTDKNRMLEHEMAERTRLEQEKDLARAEAIRTSQLAALGELAAGVAHEINTPLNTIINSADLLLEDGDRASLEQDAGVIKKQGRRIAAIVKSLLFFSRLPTKDMIPFGVADMLQGALDMMGGRLRKEHVSLNVTLPPVLPHVLVRPQQIEQVFLNLLTNGLHALAERYVDAADCKLIEISASVHFIDQRRFVRITFRDNGVGIPAHLLASVKNAFVTTKQSGTGLGLSICQQIIDAHDGVICLESKAGEYTKVQIDLPTAISV